MNNTPMTLALALAACLPLCACGDETTPDSSAYTIAADVQAAILKAHNDERKDNTDGTVPPLTWSAEPEKVAMAYAATLEAAGTCTLVHNKNRGDHGENLWMMGLSSGLTYADFDATLAASAVTAWINEKPDYSYANNSCATGKMCGHYTQIVWKTTKTVGCAILACQGTYPSLILICNYAPPGNYVGVKPF
jgi:pathogenesis-related protein 1